MAAKELIQTITVGSGGASEIVFSSIPQTGTDLLLTFSLRSDSAGQTIGDIYPQLNGDTTWANYTDRMLNGTGSSAQSQVITLPYAWINGAAATANSFAVGQIYVPNYTGSTSKLMSIDAVTEQNGTTWYGGLQIVRYSPTTAITSFRISGGANFVQYSTVSLYPVTKGSGGATVS